MGNIWVKHYYPLTYFTFLLIRVTYVAYLCAYNSINPKILMELYELTVDDVLH